METRLPGLYAVGPLGVPRLERTAVTLGEVLVLAGLLPALLLWLKAAWFLDSGFVWLAVVPVLLGMRYGVAAGAGAALLLAADIGVFAYLNPDHAFPSLQASCLLLLGMTAGQFRDSWSAKLRRVQSECTYHQARLEQFTRSYHLLSASHAQLEQRLGASATSLRTLLHRLKLRQPPATHSDGALGGIGDWILGVFVEAGQLHTAALHTVSDRGTVHFPAVASVGEPPELSQFDPLVREAIHTGCVASVRAGHEGGPAQPIAVVPLIDASGRIHGIVSVSEMSFSALHQGTFDLLAVVGGHVGDILSRRARPVVQASGLWNFRHCLERCLCDARSCRVPSSLVAFGFPASPEQDAVVDLLCKLGRGLDESWVSTSPQGELLILQLLPLTDAAGAKCYVERALTVLREELGEARLALAPRTEMWHLSRQRSVDSLLQEICMACNLEPGAVGLTRDARRLKVAE